MLLFPNFSKFSSYRELGCSLWMRANHVPTHSLTDLSIRGLLDQTKWCWARKREICDSSYCRYVSCLTPRKPFYAMKEEEEKAIFSLLLCFAVQS